MVERSTKESFFLNENFSGAFSGTSSMDDSILLHDDRGESFDKEYIFNEEFLRAALGLVSSPSSNE